MGVACWFDLPTHSFDVKPAMYISSTECNKAITLYEVHRTLSLCCIQWTIYIFKYKTLEIEKERKLQSLCPASLFLITSVILDHLFSPNTKISPTFTSSSLLAMPLHNKTYPEIHQNKCCRNPKWIFHYLSNWPDSKLCFTFFLHISLSVYMFYLFLSYQANSCRFCLKDNRIYIQKHGHNRHGCALIYGFASELIYIYI
jgi:hypothetical protein